MDYGKLRIFLLDYITMLTSQVSDNLTDTKLKDARKILDDVEDVIYERGWASR